MRWPPGPLLVAHGARHKTTDEDGVTLYECSGCSGYYERRLVRIDQYEDPCYPDAWCKDCDPRYSL